jgi:hypothetical protein
VATWPNAINATIYKSPISISFRSAPIAMHPQDRPPINRRSVERVLKANFLPRLHALADGSDIERVDIIKAAIGSYERSRVKLLSGGYPKPVNKLELELIEIVDEAVNIGAITPTKTSGKSANRRTLKDPQQAIYYVRILIESFQEVLEYDPVKNHNRPAPTLRLEDPAYLDFVRELIAELKLLNSLLSKKKGRQAATIGTVASLSKHFDKFLSSYAGAMGKVTAGLTGGAIVALLYHAGVGKEVIDGLWGQMKLRWPK